jgi:thioredoxin reductase (NADPH)
MQRVDVTILGGGPSGLFAAFYAGLRGMSVRILDSLPQLGGQLVALYPEKYVYDMPGFPKVLAKDLAAALVEQATQFGPYVDLGETAERLLDDGPDGYTIQTSAGSLFPTRSIIIAAGAGAFQPAKLGAQGEEAFEGRGLSYGVRDKAEFEGRRVVIVGGGDSAFDWALDLHGTASGLVLVHRRDQFRAHEKTVQQVRDLGVAFHLWSAVKELHGDGALEAITLENTRTKERRRLEADAVIVNIGFKASLGPLSSWGLRIEKHAILVDGHFETDLPNVFAVGDVASYPSKIKLIATGVGEAATAVCVIKTRLDPSSKLFPGHSSDMTLPEHHPPQRG